MTVQLDDAKVFTYLARRLRKETYGCAEWDEAGTYAVIREFVGHTYSETLHLVVGHAMDPAARTPGAMRRPFVPKRDDGGRRQPAKAGEDCKRHAGEYVGSCRACAVEQYDAPTDPVLADDDRSAGQRLRDELRARRLGGTPQPSPAPDVASEPAVDDAAGAPGRAQPDVQQRAGESDQRPETACAADGCYRPTRDGICDRCRQTAAAEDVATANTELIEQLHANDRARAHTRPPVDPGPPRYFTSADYDPVRVHAAQARAATQRSNA